jgi:hypothetical protein
MLQAILLFNPSERLGCDIVPPLRLVRLSEESHSVSASHDPLRERYPALKQSIMSAIEEALD